MIKCKYHKTMKGCDHIEISIKLLEQIDDYGKIGNQFEIMNLISEMEKEKKRTHKSRKKLLLLVGLTSAYSYYGEILKKDFFIEKLNNLRLAINIINELKPYEIKDDILFTICQVYRIYANLLDDCGRSNLAIEYYHKIYELNPKLSWGLLDYAVALNQYSWTLNVPQEDIKILKYVSCQLFENGFKFNGKYSLQEKYKASYLCRYKRFIDEKIRNQNENERVVELTNLLYLKEKFDPSTEEEKLYYHWVYDQILFLHPLNEIKEYSQYFMFDLLHINDALKERESFDICQEMYNEIKQSFLFSRLLMYEALSENLRYDFDPDLNSNIISEKEGVIHSIKYEKLKIVLKLCYSCYDKVAFLINAYFDLKISEHECSMATIWESDKLKENNLDKPSLLHGPTKNRGLNGLYWNMLDIKRCINDEFLEELEISGVSKMRNYLEHRHFCVVANGSDYQNSEKVMHITEAGISEKAIRMMKLLREALFCLCTAINIEEQERVNLRS